MKLVGRYKFNVVTVDIGRNQNGNDMIRLGLDFTEEFVNSEWHPLEQKIKPQNYNMSLKLVPGRSGKSAAQVTAEKLKVVFNYSDPLSQIHNLLFRSGECICEDHNEGNFTRISDIYPVGSKPKQQAGFVELSPDVRGEIDKLIDALK